MWEKKNKVSESNMAEAEDGCHLQVEWEWMSLNQIKSVLVRVRVERECFWVNLREENKVFESIMAEFNMAAIIKLRQNEWVKIFCANSGKQSWQVWVSLRGKTKMAEGKTAEFKMTAII